MYFTCFFRAKIVSYFDVFFIHVSEERLYIIAFAIPTFPWLFSDTQSSSIKLEYIVLWRQHGDNSLGKGKWTDRDIQHGPFLLTEISWTHI